MPSFSWEKEGVIIFGKPYVSAADRAKTENFCCICEKFTKKARCPECGEKTYSPNAMSGGI